MHHELTIADSDRIEAGCIKMLDKVCNDCLNEGLLDSKWTTKIQEQLTHHAKKLGFETHASRADKAYNEWLYDVTWFETSQSDFLLKIPLITEIEWNSSEDEIFYDFEKLLQSTAEHKLMIFQKGRSKWEETMDKLEKSVHLFNGRLINDRYLFACFVNGNKGEKGCFKYRLVVK